MCFDLIDSLELRRFTYFLNLKLFSLAITLTTRYLNAPTGGLALLIVLCRCDGICRQAHRGHSTAENKRFLQFHQNRITRVQEMFEFGL